MGDVDLAWEHEKEDIFNVVADIDRPSARIEYAFRAGYLAAAEDGLVELEEGYAD